MAISPLAYSPAPSRKDRAAQMVLSQIAGFGRVNPNTFKNPPPDVLSLGSMLDAGGPSMASTQQQPARQTFSIGGVPLARMTNDVPPEQKPGNGPETRRAGSTLAGEYVAPGGIPKQMFSDAPIANAPMQTTLGTDRDIASVGSQIANARTKRPGFFEDNGLGEKILHGAGEFATQALAWTGNPIALGVLRNRRDTKRAQQQAEFARRDREVTWAHDAEVARAKAALPVFRNVGNEVVQIDPTTGQASQLYKGALAAEDYADSLGYEPGSEDYQNAMQDYVLRGNGPTAYQYDADLEGVRQRNRVDLEGTRQGNRMALKTAPTYANLHPRAPAPRQARAPRLPTASSVMGGILNSYASGEPLNPQQAALLNNYTSRGGRGGRGNPLLVPGGVPNVAPRQSGGGGVRKVSSPAEAMKLPPGTRFQTPDGKVKVRP